METRPATVNDTPGAFSTGGKLTHHHAYRLGAWLIALSLLFRIWGDSCVEFLRKAWEQGELQSMILYLETGRKVRFSPSLEEKSEFVAESPPPLSLESEQRPVFSREDAEALALTDMSGCDPDLASLVTAPLDWSLKGDSPAVLILHTHTTESYTPSGEGYAATSAYRTLEEEHNMLCVGDHLAELLSRGGITVIHDREVHDYPSYNGSYSHARESTADYLQRYPGIRLVLDLHRDAAGEDAGQLRTLANVAGQDSAQLMLVVGTDASGLHHPRWQENLSLALKLQTLLERNAPGITRPVNLRSQRFNQDLSPGALIIEIGAAGNTKEEALRATELLSQAILQLADGSQ